MLGSRFRMTDEVRLLRSTPGTHTQKESHDIKVLGYDGNNKQRAKITHLRRWKVGHRLNAPAARHSLPTD